MFMDPFKQSRWDKRYATSRREVRTKEGVPDESPSFHHVTVQNMLVSWYGVFVGIAPIPKEFADYWITISLQAGHAGIGDDARERDRNMAVLRSFILICSGKGSHADEALVKEYFGSVLGRTAAR